MNTGYRAWGKHNLQGCQLQGDMGRALSPCKAQGGEQTIMICEGNILSFCSYQRTEELCIGQ